jgi:ABC-type multidrug transport system fused ATPase/permease subunit
MFITMMFAAVSVLVVIGYVTPFFLAALLPLGWVYRFTQAYYLRSSRELKRLDSISRSPIYAHFGETLTGVNTIRAFGRVEEFKHENVQRLDTNQRAFFASNSSNRWLGIRLEFLGTIVVTLAALFAVIERDSIDGGAAGLSITYALQTTALLNWMVRMYTEMETQMVWHNSGFKFVVRCVKLGALSDLRLFSLRCRSRSSGSKNMRIWIARPMPSFPCRVHELAGLSTAASTLRTCSSDTAKACHWC